ncbi:hypothetical protein Ddc_09084 [Ditylenchus destructor]|nr:hypothetical protein Ddc_09084 [Ditylenchus destructor]
MKALFTITFILILLFACTLGAEEFEHIHEGSGPCVDRGQFCDKLRDFCNDFKYQTLINKECRMTCKRC